MQYCGYSSRYREQVVRSALKAYEEIKRKEREQETPMYRSKEWKRKERQQKKREKRENWYKKGGYDSIVFVPPTPKSKLRKRFEKEIKNTEFKIKVVETAGRSVKNILQKSDPFDNQKCSNKEKCMVCRNNNKGKCRDENVTYKITCNKCSSIYIGESARNGYSRGLEHQALLEKQDKDSVLLRHTQNKHPDDETPVFSMSIIKKHKSAMDRQISEAVHISNQPENDLMNQKSEWGHQKVTRCVLAET